MPASFEQTSVSKWKVRRIINDKSLAYRETRGRKEENQSHPIYQLWTANELDFFVFYDLKIKTFRCVQQ